MKRIGIITLYYKNNNYGGVAQAYALNQYFIKKGFDSELITYAKEKSVLNLANNNKDIRYKIKKVYNKTNKTMKGLLEKRFKKRYEPMLKKREEKLEDFRNNIPHSKVYDNTNISEIRSKYDYYVTGSDQCWNPSVITGSFVYDFLNKENARIFSYASSVAVDRLSPNYIKYMKNELKKYNKISVRETNTAQILEKETGYSVKDVIDPTLLLEREDWSSIVSDRLINERYVVSYILGNSKDNRKIAKRIAKENGLILVTIPYIKNGMRFEFKIEDYKFGDKQMIDISFNDFLSLIKNSECVVTDSFHAICFSYIFRKEFFALEKDGIISTSSRLKSLLDLMGISERLINKKTNYKELNRIDYDIVDEVIREKKNLSKSFIDEALSTDND